MENTPLVDGMTYLITHAEVKYLTAKKELMGALTELNGADVIGLDIETSKLNCHPLAGLNPKVSKVRLIQLYDGKTCYVVDVDRLGMGWMNSLKDKYMVAHNAQFEDGHLFHAGIKITNLHCSLLMARVFIGEMGLSLRELSQDAFGVVVDKTLQVSDWGEAELTDDQINYAALDAVLTYKLKVKFDEWFTEYPHYRDTYEFLRQLLHPTTKQMAMGVQVDVSAHEDVIKLWLASREAALEGLLALNFVVPPEDVKARAKLRKDGVRFVTSAKDKQAVLKERLSDEEYASWPVTKSGNLKTDLASLSALDQYPELQALGAYSAISSKLANYGRKLSDLLIDGKLYPQYRIAGMVSGRFSCTKPNLQNQPRKGLKHIYVAPEGMIFVGADLAQVELRVAGLLSEDEVINECYIEGVDLHKAMANDMVGRMTEHQYQLELAKFDGDEARLMKHLRQGAKGINFGLLYGSGARGLQAYCKATYGVEMTLAEAEEYRQLFHTKYVGFSAWQKLIVAHSQRHGEVESPYSRLTRHFKEQDYFKGALRSDPYTICMNFPVQSGAWEILALAIVYIDERLPVGSYISHHVYDELVLLCPEEMKGEMAQLLLDGFIHGYQTVFPGCNTSGICEVSWGKTWAELSNPDNIINQHDTIIGC